MKDNILGRFVLTIDFILWSTSMEETSAKCHQRAVEICWVIWVGFLQKYWNSESKSGGKAWKVLDWMKPQTPDLNPTGNAFDQKAKKTKKTPAPPPNVKVWEKLQGCICMQGVHDELPKVPGCTPASRMRKILLLTNRKLTIWWEWETRSAVMMNLWLEELGLIQTEWAKHFKNAWTRYDLIMVQSR